jgi:hypothetical protein
VEVDFGYIQICVAVVLLDSSPEPLYSLPEFLSVTQDASYVVCHGASPTAIGQSIPIEGGIQIGFHPGSVVVKVANCTKGCFHTRSCGRQKEPEGWPQVAAAPRLVSTSVQLVRPDGLIQISQFSCLHRHSSS